MRTRLTADFTVIANALAQRRGSAVTVGVAAYILSLPDGSPVSIAALCEHFTEGEILISRALRELEAAGYLERRRERLSTGQIRTRTYFYDVPGDGTDPDGPATPPKPPRARTASVAKEATPPSATATDPTLADADPQVVAVLTSLRRVDPRLVLSSQEAARLAPAVSRWLATGLDPVRIVSVLTEGLPDRFLGRPVGILAYRLRETPLPLPAAAAVSVTAEEGSPAVIHPLRNCDGCDRAFRPPVPGQRCRDCRSEEPLRAVC